MEHTLKITEFTSENESLVRHILISLAIEYVLEKNFKKAATFIGALGNLPLEQVDALSINVNVNKDVDQWVRHMCFLRIESEVRKAENG